MTVNRRTGLPSVFASADSAGTIASYIGSASVVPRPRRIVRRGIAFLVIITALPPHSHLERNAAGDSSDDRRPAVVVGRRVPNDLPHHRPVVVLEPAAQRV